MPQTLAPAGLTPQKLPVRPGTNVILSSLSRYPREPVEPSPAHALEARNFSEAENQKKIEEKKLDRQSSGSRST